MSYAAVSLIKATQLKNNHTYRGSGTMVDSIAKGYSMRVGQPTGWVATEDYGRGNMAVTYSQWAKWNSAADALPGGSLTWTSAAQIRLLTVGGGSVNNINSRAEIRDSAHHAAPSNTQRIPALGTVVFHGLFNIVAMNPDTYVTVGIARSHASGVTTMDSCICFINVTDTGYKTTWHVMLKRNNLSTPKFVDTGVSFSTANTLSIYYNPRLGIAEFYAAGSLVHTETDRNFLPSTVSTGNVGIAIREPDTKWDGTAAPAPVIQSILRTSSTPDGFGFSCAKPGYWMSPNQTFQNPW